MATPNLKPKIVETTWLEDITYVEAQPMPGDSGRILLFTLSNGHRYAIPLSGVALQATQRAVSPVIVAEMKPNNGTGL
jgi:hypothetical protein